MHAVTVIHILHLSLMMVSPAALWRLSHYLDDEIQESLAKHLILGQNTGGTIRGMNLNSLLIRELSLRGNNTMDQSWILRSQRSDP